MSASGENGPHLYGEQVTLPLVVIKGYPFLEGSINNKEGKLLFDVGEADALSVDSHTVTQPGGVVIGHGFFGSGQTYEKLRFPIVDDLKLGSGLHFEKMANVGGNPGLPLEQHITPDFIGWIGVNFWKGYVFKLDYAKPAVTFYRNDATKVGELAAEAGETVLQEIAFTNQTRNLPLIHIKIGNLSLTGTVDTGAHSTAYLSDAEVANLESAGTLSKLEEGFRLSGVTIDGKGVEPMHVDVTHSRPPFAKLLPEPDEPFLVFGYEFLSRYKTVWDYDKTSLKLLKK